MKYTYLVVFSLWLATPVWAADGDSCKFTTSTVTIGAGNANIPMPGTTCGNFQGGAGTLGNGCSNTQSQPQITCRVLCDKTAPGAFSCGPMWVPGGGSNVDLAIVRVLNGTSAAGCGYDDINVYTLSNTNTAAGAELPSLGTLDDEGSSSGVKQIEHFGPIGPYLYLSGTADDTGALTCDASNHLLIQLLIYPKPAIH